MMRAAFLVIPLIVISLGVSSLPNIGIAAETAPQLVPGEKVRVTVPTPESKSYKYAFPERRHVGVYLGPIDKSLALGSRGSTGDTLLFSYETILKLEVAQGRRSQIFKGAAVGALVGAFAGIIAVVAATDNSDDQAFGFALLTPITAGAGLFLGGIAGLLIRTDRWAKVDNMQYDLGVIMRPEGEWNLGLKMSF